MDYNLVVDADSILYTSCYRHQVVRDGICGVDLELSYMEFVGTITKIKDKMYLELMLTKDDSIEFEIVFSPKHTFRHDLTDTYKADRPHNSIRGIEELKQMVTKRIGSTLVKDMEADDIVITRAYEKENVIIACIDKDIYTHSPVRCINYRTWNWTEALSEYEIEEAYWVQALMGDRTDGIKGAKGIGVVKANEIVRGSLDEMNFENYAMWFESEDEAILSMRLVRLDQYKKGELVLWNPTY